MMDEDDFYALRTAYYIGDYDKVEVEYKNLSDLTGMKAKERDSFYCRSLIAQRRFKEVENDVLFCISHFVGLCCVCRPRDMRKVRRPQWWQPSNY